MCELLVLYLADPVSGLARGDVAAVRDDYHEWAAEELFSGRRGVLRARGVQASEAASFLEPGNGRARRYGLDLDAACCAGLPTATSAQELLAHRREKPAT